jgi:hypothetical protein
VSSLQVGAPGAVHARIGYARLTRVTRRHSTLVHSHIAGRVEGGSSGEERVIACAVDGTIRALGRSFHLMGDSPETSPSSSPSAGCGLGATGSGYSR